jgi:hypothetical protein
MLGPVGHLGRQLGGEWHWPGMVGMARLGGGQMLQNPCPRMADVASIECKAEDATAIWDLFPVSIR